MEEEKGLSFVDILKIILKRVWWVVGAAALCVVIAVLVVQFWYNRKSRFYTVSYELVYPESESGKYPDNSYLLASEFVSASTLGKIKESDKDKFGSIDIDDMLENDKISITEQVTKDTTDVIKRKYTLNVTAKYFSSKEQAREFIRKIAAYPVDRINTTVAAKEYGTYFRVYDEADTYEGKIEALVAQKSYLEKAYDALKNYGNEAAVGSASLHNVFTETQQKALLSRLSVNGYVIDIDAYKANAEVRKAELNQKIADNEARIEALEGASDDKTEPAVASAFAAGYAGESGDDKIIISNLILSLKDETAQMKIEQDEIDRTLGKIEKYTQEGSDEYKAWKAFEAQLDGYRESLVKATGELKKVNVSIYESNSQVIFNTNKIALEGGLNIVLAAVIGLIGGLLVASLVVCIIDAPKYKKELLKAEAGANGEAGAPANDKSAKAEAGGDGNETAAADGDTGSKEGK